MILFRSVDIQCLAANESADKKQQFDRSLLFCLR